MPNPNELQRMEEELEDLVESLPHIYNKKLKEECLREVRRLEGLLGIESKPYNQ
jgi:hypothetical protein